MVTAGSIEMTGSFSEIVSDNFGDGDAGAVTVIADHLELRDNAGIRSDTHNGAGDAGSVTVTAGDLVMRSALITSETGSENIAADAGSVTSLSPTASSSATSAASAAPRLAGARLAR